MSYVSSVARFISKIREQLFDVDADHGLSSLEINQYSAVKSYDSVGKTADPKSRDATSSSNYGALDAEAAYTEIDSIRSRNILTESNRQASQTNEEKIQPPVLGGANNPTGSYSGQKFSFYSFMWSLVVAIVIIAVFYFAFLEYSLLRSPQIDTGTRIQLKTYDGRFIRVDTTSSNYTLIASEAIPWVLGSTFEVEVSPKKLWKLKSLTGQWVRVGSYEDVESGISRNAVFADVTNIEYASAFKPSRSFFSRKVKLTLDSTALSLSIRQPGPSDISPFAILAATPPSSSLTESFELNILEPLHGVNLGGWFIPEVSGGVRG